MAAKKDGPNKSAFIRDLLTKNPKITVKEVAAAWVGGGNKDELNPTLYYQVKKSMGIKSKGRRGRGPGRPPKSATAAIADAGSSKSDGYIAIESALDRLIRDAESLRDNSLVEKLRAARRQVSAKLV